MGIYCYKITIVEFFWDYFRPFAICTFPTLILQLYVLQELSPLKKGKMIR